MPREYFGTDGIRGRFGQEPITPEFSLRLGWALGRTLSGKSGQPRKVVIGRDTRVSGPLLESVLGVGLSYAGVEVGMLGAIPTPAVAYLTRTMGADAGIVVSASHNPFHDNGVKFFDGAGNKLADEQEIAIEGGLSDELAIAKDEEIGISYVVPDAASRYIEYCKSTIERGRDFSKIKVVLDCANGATYEVAPRVFSELGADIDVIHAEPDGKNINTACGSTYPESLMERVESSDADVGIAFDGDGDRVVMVTGDGRLVDGDELLYVIAQARLERNRLNGGVVGTVMSNYGLEIALEDLGISFKRSKVGDRYVLERLRELGWILGGESSGHLIALDVSTTGDGIVAAMQVLEAIRDAEKPLEDLLGGMQKLPQVMINVRTKTPKALAEHARVLAAVADLEEVINGTGQVVLRPSGTEPVVRVMVEGADEAVVRAQAQSLADVIEELVVETDSAVGV